MILKDKKFLSSLCNSKSWEHFVQARKFILEKAFHLSPFFTKYKKTNLYVLIKTQTRIFSDFIEIILEIGGKLFKIECGVCVSGCELISDVL